MRRRLSAVLLSTALVVSACGSTSPGSAEANGAAVASMSAAAAASAQAAAERAAAAKEAALAAQAERNAAAAKAAADEAAAKAEAAARAQAEAAKAKAAKDKAATAAAAKEAAAKAGAAKLKAAAAAKAKAAADAKAKAAAAAREALRFDLINGGIRSNNPVVAVKIDNTSAGRPQFGLASADVVYVEQVEGGLTRLIGLFHSNLPTEVGPVRSVRSTDVDLLQAYGRPVLAFSGGAGGPLARLAGSPLIDASGGPGYWRSNAKPAPYNLHVNVKQLAAATPGKQPARSPGFTFASNYPALHTAPRRHTISVTMSAGNTGFVYSVYSKSYRVNHSGTPSVDAAGNPLTSKNVLVQHVTDHPDGTVDTNGQPSLLSQTTGKGDFTLYRNGHKITGRWFRFGLDQPTKYLDSHEKPVPFERGRTWVLLAAQNAVVTDS